MDKIVLQTFVEKNSHLISVKQSKIFPELYILKYKNKCFYKNIWNCYIEKCRGLVIDKNYNIIIHPFDKIYNYGIEQNAPIINDNEEVIACPKINGFMLAVSWYNGTFIFSTTGSLDSDFVEMGKEMFFKQSLSDLEKLMVLSCEDNYTHLFEVCHSDDPHIIKEKNGIHRIGKRKNEYNAYVEPEGENCFSIEMGALKKLIKEIKHEGYVIYTKTGRATKIKSPYYLVSKLFARKKDIEELFSKNIKNRIDEEYYPLVDYIKKNKEFFNELTEQERLDYIRYFLENYI